MPKRNTYHSHGDVFLAKQEGYETLEEHKGKLLSSEKKFTTSITDKKVREILIREKTLKLKTTTEIQASYEKRHKQSTIPTALVKAK